MHVEVRLFATFRDVVDARSVEREAPEGATVGDVLRELADDHPELDIFTDAGALREYVNVLCNGRSVVHDDGLDTPLDDGDEVGLFPPVEGG